MIKGMKTRTPRAGKIRGGIKKISPKTGKEYPAATPHWVIPDEVAEVVGEKPSQLPIRFAADTLEEVFPQWLKAYKSGKLFCRGDGETANRSTENGFEEIECTPEECPLYQKGDCRPIGTLNFYIDGVKSLGVYQWDTSSVRNIQEINGAIAAIQGLYGHLKGIPLWLTREKTTSSNGHAYYKAHLKLREPAEQTKTTQKSISPEKIVGKSQPRPREMEDLEKNSEKSSEKASLVPENSENAIYEKLKKIEGGTTLNGVRALLTACFDIDYSDAGKYVIRNMDDKRRQKFLEWLEEKYPEE